MKRSSIDHAIKEINLEYNIRKIKNCLIFISKRRKAGMNIAVVTLYNFPYIYVIKNIYYICILMRKILYNIFELARVQIQLNKWVSWCEEIRFFLFYFYFLFINLYYKENRKKGIVLLYSVKPTAVQRLPNTDRY